MLSSVRLPTRKLTIAFDDFRHGEEEVLIALFSAVCRRPFSLLLADE